MMDAALLPLRLGSRTSKGECCRTQLVTLLVTQHAPASRRVPLLHDLEIRIIPAAERERHHHARGKQSARLAESRQSVAGAVWNRVALRCLCLVVWRAVRLEIGHEPRSHLWHIRNKCAVSNATLGHTDPAR